MFTGLVEGRGEVVRLEHADGSVVLDVRAAFPIDDITPGSSIAVDGCCLTVVDADPAGSRFTAHMTPETLAKTALGHRRTGDLVNLERPLRADQRLGGHFVQGHIDGTGAITERTRGPGELLRIALPAELAVYVAPKGSIAVDGVSLTVVDVADTTVPSFTIALIPTTCEVTTLGSREVGSLVNLEVDVLAKYVARAYDTRGAATV